MISRRVTQVCGLLPLFVFAAFGQNLSLADREKGLHIWSRRERHTKRILGVKADPDFPEN
jgi:hypothetical protein